MFRAEVHVISLALQMNMFLKVKLFSRETEILLL